MNARLAWQLLATLLIAAGAFLFVPLFGKKMLVGVQSKNLNNARQLALACKLYAQDHEGRFPVYLNELELDYIQTNGLRCFSVGRDNEPKYQMDWLYFGAGFDEANPPLLLIASPQATTTAKRQTRVAVMGDTSGQIVNEDKYEQLLNGTVKQMHAVHESRQSKTGVTPK